MDMKFLLNLLLIPPILVFSTRASEVVTTVRDIKQLTMENLKAIPDTPSNDSCANQTNLLIQKLFKDNWATQMFDASTKFPDSMLMGLLINLGNFEECLKVKNVQTAYGKFNAQFCLAAIVLPTNKSIKTNVLENDLPHTIAHLENHVGGRPGETSTIQLSYCIPSVCSPEDWKKMLSDNIFSRFGLPIQVSDVKCQQTKERELSAGDWTAVVILIIIAALAVSSTSYDLFMKDSKNKLLTSFSWYSNGKKLLTAASTADTLEAIHGIRFLSMCWVVLGHEYLMNAITPAINFRTVTATFVPDFWRLYITNGALSVDSFFFLSGLLVSYIFLKEMNKENAKFNIISYYIHRYIRLTPPYAMMILLEATLQRHASSGPIFNSVVDSIAEKCQKNWWTNLLYINNYVENKGMCVEQGWYLAIDMQLFLLSPIVLFPLWKWPARWSLSLLGVLSLGGLITTFTISFIKELPVSLITIDQTYKYLMYYPTHTRFVPWLIGVGFGYLFHKTKELDVKLPKKYVLLGWCIGTTALLGSLIGMYPFNQTEKIILYIPGTPKDFADNFEASIYTTLSRPLWALGVGWVAYACVFGYGGPVNTFLSWKLFQPLSRLTYCVYLVHLSVQNIRTYSHRTPVYVSDIETIPGFFGDLVISLLLAALLSLCVEAPTITLENHFVKGGRSRSHDNESQPETENVNEEVKQYAYSPLQETNEISSGSNMDQATDQNEIRFLHE